MCSLANIVTIKQNDFILKNMVEMLGTGTSQLEDVITPAPVSAPIPFLLLPLQQRKKKTFASFCENDTAKFCEAVR